MKKLFFVLLALCLSFSTGGNVFASATEDSEGEAVSAYYIKNGEKIYIPKEDFVELFNQNSVYELPGDTSVEKNQGTTITPYANVCVPGYEYDARLMSGAFENHHSGTRQANKTSGPIGWTSTVTKGFDINPSVSATGGFDWKVIEAEVGFNISATWSWQTSEAVQVSIPVNRMGWNDFGSYREQWTGTHYYLTGSCGKSNQVTVTPKGSKYKLNVARESAIPPGV
ncbi:hypothetical protein [Sporosarcina sp. BP05]|uniref:hypothetical protein n=1 Tax=Sporosarcina sp. BP05 TaxID=2758726 RepID=UPI001645EFA5|nr:hypothetical protein [Sporosarcina sp. BP05]